MRARALAAATCLVLAACSEDEVLPPPDAGVVVDAGVVPDAGPADVGFTEFALTVDFVGNGPGRVTSAPAGVDCNDDCTEAFDVGAQVTLTAVAADGAVFAGWEEVPECGAEPTCTVTLDQDRTVEVRFSRVLNLVIEGIGDGLGVVLVDGERCFGLCELEVVSNTFVNLEAVPAAGVEFVGWGGSCSGPDPECRLGISQNNLVEALFEVRRPQLDVGDRHACALTPVDQLRCWGFGASGRLGYATDDDIGDDEAPSMQPNLSVGFDVAQIAVGAEHSCALSSAGDVRCWGDNRFGQLGQGNTDAVGGAGRPAPSAVPVVDLGGPALQVAAGARHTCALMATGTVRCWGSGADGRLGYGDTADVGRGGATPSPAEAGDVPLTTTARFVAAGEAHTCAILDGGDVVCWGDNSTGQLGYAFGGSAGDGTAGRATPAELEALPLGAPVQSLTLGTGHTCVRFTDQRVRCFGDNTVGQLGDGTNSQVGGMGGLAVDTAIDVLLGLDRVVEIAVGADHGCVILQNGTIRCWGEGETGALGGEATDDENAPLPAIMLPAGHRPVALSAGPSTTCTATRFGLMVNDFSVFCWGSGRFGARGSGDTASAGDRAGTMPPDPSDVF